jgi:hypothetical protein
MKRRLFALLALIPISGTWPPIALAVFPPGDILLNFIGGDPKLQQYHPDGTLVQTFDGTGFSWEGATPMGNDKVVTTRRLDKPGINIFDTAGHELTFDIGTGIIPGDVSAFTDGTLAVSDQLGSIRLYSQSGSLLKSFTIPANSPLGSAVGLDNTLWVATYNGSSASPIYHFSSDGSYLGSIALTFRASDIAIDPTDGTLWVPQVDSAAIHHFNFDGIELAQFQSLAEVNAIAVSIDGSIFAAGRFSGSVYHFSRSGDLLGSFTVQSTGRPVFMGIVTIPEPAARLSLFLALVLLTPHRRAFQRR